ncbi:hypothetical protein [Brasilonema bromeliae]|nr:hypothetical protein [Brasilonema bromeliae]
MSNEVKARRLSLFLEVFLGAIAPRNHHQVIARSYHPQAIA